MTFTKIMGGFLLIGILVVLLSRVEYKASMALMPESASSQSSASSLLRQYGGMIGMSGVGSGSGGGIPARLYPDIISSIPFQVELMQKPVRFSTLDTVITPHEYFQKFYPLSALDYIKKYTIGLPGYLMKDDKNKIQKLDPIVKKIERDSVISLSGQQSSTIGKLMERITINSKEGLITLSAEFPDPRASAEIGVKAMELLKEYVRKYHTRKAKEELKFVRQQLQKAKKRFEKAQQKLAEFRDSNVNLATAKAKTREQELQSKYELAFSLYQSLSQKLEQAKLKVQEETPVFTVLKPMQVPKSSSKPKTKIIILVSLILGFVVSITWLLGKQVWQELRSQVSVIN